MSSDEDTTSGLIAEAERRSETAALPLSSAGARALPSGEMAGEPRELQGKLKGLSLPRQVYVLAVWPFFELLLNSLVGVVDTALAGRIDAASLDAIGVGAYVQWLLGMLNMAVGVGAAALIARAVGANHKGLANAGLGQALVLAAIWGTVTSVAIWGGAPWITAIFQLSEVGHGLAVTYLRWVALGATMLALMLVGNACLRSAGDTRTPFVAMVLVNVVNTIASLLFTFGPEPIGGHGVAGIAMGTTVAWVVGAMIVMGVLLSGKAAVKLRLARLRPRWELSKRIIKVGLPSLIESSGMWLGNAMIAGLVGMLAAKSGKDGLMGTHIVAIRVEAMSFLPGIALGTAAATLMGQYLGLGDQERAKRAVMLCWAVGAGLMTMMGVSFLVVPHWYAAVLVAGDTEELRLVRDMAVPLIRICGPIQMFFATYLVLSQALRGAGETRGPMLITYGSTFLVRLPAAYLIGHVMGYGLTGIWFALCGELVVRGCLYMWRFKAGHWREIEV